MDNDPGYSELIQLLKDLGVTVELRAEYTEEQNSQTERAGSTIVVRARAIRLGGRIPLQLSNECCITAVYPINRTPTEVLGWRTPYEAAHRQKPTAAHLSSIGQRAYVLNTRLKHGEKLQSRALLGQLIGYNSTNIYRV
jgi:hypothetical protein